MANSLENLSSEALLLPADQPVTLAGRLLASVEPGESEDIETAWDAEIRERIRRYDAGEAVEISGCEVLVGLDRKLAD